MIKQLAILFLIILFAVFVNSTLLVVIHELGHLIIGNGLLGLTGHIEYNFGISNIFDFNSGIQHGGYYVYNYVNMSVYEELLLDFGGILFEFIFYIGLYLILKKYKGNIYIDIILMMILLFMFISLLYNFILPVQNDGMLLRSLIY